MTGQTDDMDEAAADLGTAVASVAAEHGTSWFPELRNGPVRVRLLSRLTRPRCLLYRFDVHDDRAARPVMVKVRHSDPGMRRPDDADRPILAPVRVLSDQDTARREYDGLLHIQRVIAEHDDADARFGCLRPLAWLPEHAAIVTDFVDQPTLRTALQATSRLHLRSTPPMDARPWANAGAWLRLLHERPMAIPLPLRAHQPRAVGELLQQFAEALVQRIGSRPLLEELRSSGVAIAEAALPEIPTGDGHGDFVANNMFVSPEGRITVFDPLPLWRVPVYQDLATMTVGLRILWCQAMTHGLALQRSALDRYEAALHRGYFADRPLPRKELRVFELLVLLDRWLSLVTRGSRRRGLRPTLHRARIRLFSGHYHDEARFLAAELTGSPLSGPWRADRAAPA